MGQCVATVKKSQGDDTLGFPYAVVTNPMTHDVYEINPAQERDIVNIVVTHQDAMESRAGRKRQDDASAALAASKLPAGESGSTFVVTKVADLPPPPDLPSNSPANSPTRGA